ncbi:MAG TPA: SRPBCC family protein [Candidatus Limnocylindria bacterium]|nr:SRPBCC family protein [Candidatus Limnocylindria bacterium]
MTIDDAFDVDAPLERVWAVLKDVPRVATCIPNAEITEVVDEKTYRAKVAVKVGPVAVSYRATIVVESLDDATHTATLQVQGDETRGRGGVKAAVVSRASARDGKTHVDLHTEAQISGIVATVGGRLIEGVAKRTVAEFATNLAKLV